MMVAWAGMASSSYVGGRLFDATLSYNLSFHSGRRCRCTQSHGAGPAQLQATNRLAAVNRFAVVPALSG